MKDVQTIQWAIRECPACHGTVSRHETTVPITVAAHTVSVSGVYSRCEACGEVFFAPGEMDAAMRTANDIIKRSTEAKM